jgi:hypothetical protein
MKNRIGGLSRLSIARDQSIGASAYTVGGVGVRGATE